MRKKLNKLIGLIIALAIIFVILAFLTPTTNEVVMSSSYSISEDEIVQKIEGEQFVNHTGYNLSYNEEHELASYVSYILTKDEVFGAVDRKDEFREDPSIKTGSAELSDYKRSGYDRGHLIPAADLKFSKEAMSDSFYLSNMAPQDPTLNRGMWSSLESITRQEAVNNEALYVVTGPVLTDGPYDTIGKNDVSIPTYFYKAFLTANGAKAIGFILPNDKPELELEEYACSIDKVEEITNLDFYYTLDDDIEQAIESSYSIQDWQMQEFSSSGEVLTTTPVVAKSENKLIKTLELIFYEIKKEVFNTLNITSIAREFNLI